MISLGTRLDGQNIPPVSEVQQYIEEQIML